MNEITKNFFDFILFPVGINTVYRRPDHFTGQKMYFKLFNRITDVIEQLQQIQCQTEEICMQSGEAILLKNELDKEGAHLIE